MTLYSLVTWLAVAVLGPGSIILFVVLLVHLYRHLRNGSDP